MNYRYSISPRLFENNSIEKIEKKIVELLSEDVFVICVFDADVSRRSDAENKKLRKKSEREGKECVCVRVCVREREREKEREKEREREREREETA